ncbi:MAG TPA: ankyrin repeat domain-containing protein [Tepidisphaeraceae bacterium]|jgi:hypothetical protein|nr:ankyrin repeat domain-containing protein [Tepidisphaeraceae bacterium]
MKIVISGRATAKDRRTGQPLDPERLKALDGLLYDADVCSTYLNQSLLDTGLTGGRLQLAHTPAGDGLRVVTEYSCPTRLSHSELAKLTEETQGQWSDGIGEGCFEEYEREHGIAIDVWPMGVDRDVRTQQIDDGVTESGSAKASRELGAAVRKGDLEAVQAAIRSGADIESKVGGFPVLHSAISNSHLAIVRFLLESGADANSLNVTGGLPLTTCAFDRRVTDASAAAMATLLVEHGADVNRELKGWTPLDAAINRNKTELQHALRAKGGNSKYYEQT